MSVNYGEKDVGADFKSSDESGVTNGSIVPRSGSVSVTAVSARKNNGSGNPVRLGASAGVTLTPQEHVAPTKKQPKVSLVACIGSAPVVPSLLKTLTTSKTLFKKKGAVFIEEAGYYQITKLTRETEERSKEEGGSGTEVAILLEKVVD